MENSRKLLHGVLCDCNTELNDSDLRQCAISSHLQGVFWGHFEVSVGVRVPGQHKALVLPSFRIFCCTYKSAAVFFH